MSARGVPQFDEETGRPINVDRWQSAEYEASVQHTEQVWWLLAPNPFAVLADSTSGALTLTIRRLRTPYARLSRGVRVA